MHRPVRFILLRYAAALALVGSTLVVKLSLVPLVTQDIPFLLFFVAVTTSAWIGGLGPGIMATVVAAALDLCFFMQPFGYFEFARPDYAPRLLLFTLEGVCVSVICSSLKKARKRAEDNAREARELERQILELSDAEQRRIGHDLHDGLGQHLTGIAMVTHRLERHLDAASSPEASEAAKAHELARTAVTWTRDLCRSLSPPVLETEGLAEALCELAANAENLFNIRCTCAHDADVNLRDVTAGVHLYRIAQEAISNAVKHGNAHHVILRLAPAANGDIGVSITDDGTGFEQSSAAANGMGLRVMRYRANLIGATIDVRRGTGGSGTIVTCLYHPPQNGKTT